jgi:type III restriction enzyme
MQNVSVDAVEKGLVTLSNGKQFYTSEHFSPSVYAQSYQEEMVKLAIQRHFETERLNFERPQRMKTLTLFFIDSIRSYRGEGEENGWLTEKFEVLLRERVKLELSKSCSDEYRAYLEATLKDPHACHGGYFAEDNQNSDEEIAQQVKEILHDKKQLLSFKNEDGSWNVRRFIFSKWTLKEGWDNPNVFTICKLRSSGSEISKLQEVGRGLRLPVDEYGNRSSEEFLLNYIVDFDEADFAAKLVAEINGQSQQVAITDKIPMELIQCVAEKRNVDQFQLMMELAQKGIIKDLQGTVNGDMLGELYNQYPEFADTGLPKSKVIDRNKKNTNKIKIRPLVFDRLRDLWMKINKRYVIFFDPMLEKELEKALPMLFSKGVFAYSVMTSQREIVETDNGKMAYVQDTGVSYQTTGNRMPYNEFLKRINRVTSVPIRTLHDAMCKGIGKKGAFKQDMINDQSLARIISNITNWKIENSMQRFKYKQTAYDVKRTRLTDENGKLYEDIVQSYIGNHLDSARVADRYLYDTYTYDSELEQTNLRSSDIDEVIVFGKIPRKSIAIPTITNDSYSPDFMYIVKKTDGTKELNIIVETKGVDTPVNMRGIEEKKISCAKKFFNQLREDYPELNVNFRDQLNNQQLRTIIDEVIRDN